MIKVKKLRSGYGNGEYRTKENRFSMTEQQQLRIYKIQKHIVHTEK